MKLFMKAEMVSIVDICLHNIYVIFNVNFIEMICDNLTCSAREYFAMGVTRPALFLGAQYVFLTAYALPCYLSNDLEKVHKRASRIQKVIMIELWN